MSFVHLHTHSEYSLLDGHAQVESLLYRAEALGMPALAITDHGAMFGAAEFYKAAVKGHKPKDEKDKKPPRGPIKPVIGCEVYFTCDSRLKRDGKPPLYHLLLLAKDKVGYRNLVGLVSESHVEGFYYKPQVDLELLEKYREGLICTSACMSGIVSKSFELGMDEEARRWAETYARLFPDGDFYLEIQDQGIVTDAGISQTDLTKRIAELGDTLGLPLVATNDIHYVAAEDAIAQDMLICIQTGQNLDEERRMRFSSDQFYMKSADEMAEALSAYPEALSNTLAIAERCEVHLEFDRIILPVVDVPEPYRREDEQSSLSAYLEAECRTGLVERYGDPPPAEAVSRLEYELGVIRDKQLSGYFLVVVDFVRWAKDHGVGVGPGRGSAAGSIIAYALGITGLDPIEHDLLFERFLNPERTEMPDIDIDFDTAGRERVIGYVREKYGADKVAQVVTYSRMKARAAVRDAGRVLGYPFGVPDKIAKQVQGGPDATLKGSLDTNRELRDAYKSDTDTQRVFDAALRLEGIVRGEGVHAAAVVICPDPVSQHIPVKRDTKGGALITQYDMNIVAELGLLKMDFLGLRNINVIMDTVCAVRENHGVEVDIETIPWDDPETFALLQRGDTDALFQVESTGMKRVLRNLKPTKFSEIVAVVALFRPGPMENIDEFVARKHGRAQISYYDDRLRPILEETHGIIVYQEQVMRIAMEMAGFSAAKADKLRKGMGKKDQAIIDALEPDFLDGAEGRGYARSLAEKLWTDMRPFAAYAFNKSHAAVYAVTAYRTAYLKAHWPYEYMAANLTSYTGKTDEIVKYVAACNRAGLRVLPPDVNSSGKDFTAVGDAIRFGLAGIRNVGEGVVDKVVAERKRGGSFTSLHDFCARVDLTSMNKKTVESLIKAGAFETTGYTRKHLMVMMDECVDAALKRQRDKAEGQLDMFGDLVDVDHGFAEHIPVPNGDEWDRRTALRFEKEMLGIYVSDHPLSEYAEAVRAARTFSLGDAEAMRDGTVGWVAGIVTRFDKKPTKSGRMMGNLTIEDLEGTAEARLFPQMLEKYGSIFDPAPAEDGTPADEPIVRMKVRVDVGDRDPVLLVQEVEQLTASGFEALPGVLEVEASESALGNGAGADFRAILERFPGGDEVRVRLSSSDATRVLRMPQRVDMEAAGLHAAIKELLGPGAVA
ncbi:MAG: DNA polymerase III subunit alpha [Coriobacteriaceae bacterium]|nr:DNA polymerase III subunit alpha [Coriobacteriaceae bacterium]